MRMGKSMIATAGDSEDGSTQDGSVKFEEPTTQKLFYAAPEVKAVAEHIIPLYHKRLLGISAPIIYIFSSKAPKAHGEDAAATAQVVSGVKAYLANYFQWLGEDVTGEWGEEQKEYAAKADVKPFFVITVWDMIWKQLCHSDRMSLVDHELCHCKVEINKKGQEVLKMRPHDVEEFKEILERWGAWDSRLKAFIEAAKEFERSGRRSGGEE